MSDRDPDRVHLKVAMYPAEPGARIADLGDDDLLIVALVGPKNYLLTIVEALASFGLQDEIETLL